MDTYSSMLFMMLVSKYSGIDQVKFEEDSLLKNLKNFKGCHPQILIGPFLNTLTFLTFFSFHTA